jgi:hypothetical protein
MRSKFIENQWFIGLVVCLFLFLSAASFDQEEGTEEQTRNSLPELLEGDGPLYDLIYDLEECYDRHLEVLKAEERAAIAEREKVYEEFLKRMADLAGKRADAVARRSVATRTTRRILAIANEPNSLATSRP